jgi:plasmid maintenance system antidote protein VapI
MSQNNAGTIREAEAVLQKAIDGELVRIREALSDRNLAKVAQTTGLHENTVRNIAKARGGVPTTETIEKLSQYLFTPTA